MTDRSRSSACLLSETSRKTTTPPTGSPAPSRSGTALRRSQTPSGLEALHRNMSSAWTVSPRSARASGTRSAG